MVVVFTVEYIISHRCFYYCVHPRYSASDMKNVSVVCECFHFMEWRAASLESAAKSKTGISGELNK